VSTELPILDPEIVAELRASVGGDEEFVHELVATYLAEGAAHLQAMVDAFEGGDIDAVVRPAHTLKSSSAALGAARLAEMSRGIEHAARDGRTDGLADAISEAQATWALTELQMREDGLAE
jgi:HPt (histidine-containing phosphotransfer) domain-containing protein